jgi:O-antigen biosynthesis protein
VGTQEKLLIQLEENEEWINQMERSLAESDTSLRYHYQRAQELDRTLHEITNTVSYKVAHRIAHACRRVAPPATLRRRALHTGYRILRATPKLRKGKWVASKVMRLMNVSRRRLALLRLACGIDGDGFVGVERARIRSLPNPPRFPLLDQVDASIIIPVFNHWRDSLACLESIARLTIGLSYEVIIVDDGSSDLTPELLKRIEGMVAIRNEQNLGFIGSCNRGAAVARGDFLVFLNNDTVVTPGWLEALARTFRTIPGTGYVGAKLVYPDGRLQEAGSVIWRDGTGWNYGKLDDAGHPKYNFTREVDYCSGACAMVPRALFEQLGGFDAEFTPAYYEDTDLAFKIRHAGHKIIYQPHARIIHHEGLTSGTSLESGVKSYQVVNQKKFHRRWSERLDFHPSAPPPDSDRNIYTRDLDVASRGQILVFDHRLPFHDQDSGSLRMMEMIRAFSQTGHHVTFIPGDLSGWPGYLEDLQSIGVEVIHQPYYRSAADYMRQHGREFSLVVLSRLATAAKFMTMARRLAPQAKIVYDTVDLHFLREERQARVNQDNVLESAITIRKKEELRLATRADLTLVVSPIEKAILEHECPGIDVRILSNIFPIEENEVRGFDSRRDIIFIGSFQHAPNADAVLYFAREIFPVIRDRLPDVVFQVIGPDAPPEVVELGSPSIRVLGSVPNVRPLFDQARISVAPLRFGAGVKGKVNQSMALGVPTVVTSIAAEGMYLVHEENAMIADDPERFADSVVRLWTSRELWERVSTNGRQNIRDHFSVEAAAKMIDEVLLSAGLTVPPSGRNSNSTEPIRPVRALRSPRPYE